MKGGYSYIDSNGQLQTVQYTADALHGFRVAATNLPQDLPDVVFARAKHIADYESIRADHARIAVAYSNPVAVPLSAVPPVPTHQQVSFNLFPVISSIIYHHLIIYSR